MYTINMFKLINRLIILQQWTLGEDLCKVFPVFFYGNVAVSVLSMVGLTINRYTLILHPSRYSKIYTPLSLCFQLFAIWAFSFGIMVSKTILKSSRMIVSIFLFIVCLFSYFHYSKSGARWVWTKKRSPVRS